MMTLSELFAAVFEGKTLAVSSKLAMITILEIEKENFLAWCHGH